MRRHRKATPAAAAVPEILEARAQHSLLAEAILLPQRACLLLQRPPQRNSLPSTAAASMRVASTHRCRSRPAGSKHPKCTREEASATHTRPRPSVPARALLAGSAAPAPGPSAAEANAQTWPPSGGAALRLASPHTCSTPSHTHARSLRGTCWGSWPLQRGSTLGPHVAAAHQHLCISKAHANASAVRKRRCLGAAPVVPIVFGAAGDNG